MKEKGYDNRIEIKKKKILKRKPDNSNCNNFKQIPKKIFILYKPTIVNTKQNTLKKI